jgi:hypothetical protein
MSLVDPVLWDSRTSYLHQMVDVIAYFLKQLFEPNRRIREKGAHNYFQRLAPINLLVKQQARGVEWSSQKRGPLTRPQGVLLSE